MGPTATDVDERTNPTIESEVTTSLAQYAQKVIPALKDCEMIGTYAGIRPATQHTDYQIKSDNERYQRTG